MLVPAFQQAMDATAVGEISAAFESRFGWHILEVLARRGRERIEIYQARRDLDRLYQKLGRECVRLVEAGEISHPGVIAGAERIARQVELVALSEDGVEAPGEE